MPTDEQIAEAQEVIRICEAMGLYAGPIYRAACDLLGEAASKALADEFAGRVK